MQYYIGIDGGGTKTALCAVLPNGVDIRQAQTGSASWRELGVGNVVGSIRKAVDTLLPDGASLGGVAIGMPCYGESRLGDGQLEKAFQAAFSPAPVYIANDVQLGWAGSLALEPGINIVAGTGSIAYGMDLNGSSARSGGWDEFFSDEGSCYWVGRKMLELFAKQADGRLEKGALYTYVRDEFCLDDDFDLIDYVRKHYLYSRKQVASLHLLAEKAALAGDFSVKALYDAAAEELYHMVAAVKNRLSFAEQGWRVSYSGGLFKAGDLVMPQLEIRVRKAGGTLHPPRYTPTQGALLLAFQRFHPQALPLILSALRMQTADP